MKYKVEDEVLVKVRIVEDSEFRCGLRTHDGIIFMENKYRVFPVPDMTAEEAWEIARRVEMLSTKDINEISGYLTPAEVINNFSPQQAKAKIDAWEAAKEIKVGDEVALKSDPNNNECKFVVTIKDDEDGIISGFSVFGGDVFSGRDIKLYQKTGRHIDIEGMLKQIGGNE